MCVCDCTPAKLKTGEWGVRGTGEPPRPGDEVRVQTRGGKRWHARIVRVVYHDTAEDYWLARTEKKRDTAAPPPAVEQVAEDEPPAPPAGVVICPNCGAVIDHGGAA